MRIAGWVASLLLVTAASAAAQVEVDREALAGRIAALRAAVREDGGAMVAGVVRDRSSGAPISGARVTEDVWYESSFGPEAFIAPSTPAQRAGTAADGSFAVRIDAPTPMGSGSYGLRVLVRAEGYVAQLVSFPRRLDDDELGYALFVDLDRALQIDLTLRDEVGRPFDEQTVSWLALRADEPLEEGTALVDARGHATIRPGDLAGVEGLALHLWTPTHSVRIEVFETADGAPHLASATATLERTPEPAKLPVYNEVNLAGRHIGYNSVGCRVEIIPTDAFEVTVVSLAARPGPPFRLVWSGSVGLLEARISPGPAVGWVRLPRDSDGFRAHDAGRDRLDAGPLYLSGRTSTASSTAVLTLLAPAPRPHEHRTDDVRVVASRWPWAYEALDLLELPAGGETITVPFPAADDRHRVLAVPVLDGVEVWSRVRAVDGAFRIPRAWLEKTRLFRVMASGPRPVPAERTVLGDEPLLLELAPGKDPGTVTVRPAPRSDLVRIRVVDAEGAPRPDVGIHVRSDTFASMRTSSGPTGMAGWGPIFEPLTGLPHATMLTDARGELHLSRVPLAPGPSSSSTRTAPAAVMCSSSRKRPTT